MKLKVLGSSSNGNGYVLYAPTGSLLLEAGVPWREIQKGVDFNLKDIAGCLVSHDHKDHSKAVRDVMLAGIDVYMSEGTIESLELPMAYRLFPVVPSRQFCIKDFVILPFKTEHDAPEPLGFLIKYRPTGERLLFITDSYYSKYRFIGLNYIMIECNYIKETLDWNIENGYIKEAMRPRLLKSHFSLGHVKDFLKANDLSQCREIILLHLSSSNSDAARMIREIGEVIGIRPKVAISGLEVELELYPY
jgi:phosphoribosyl 1,2-cyclic phosphodiesterase